MLTPLVRVLIADDFEAWRTELRAILEDNPALRVVAQAQTGLEVVQQAQTLRPDLLILDIGLPILSGIEAARILAEAGFLGKVLFVSENRHWEIAEEAFRAGALGYVVKSEAGTDLLPAIDAVLFGKQFVSTSLKSSWVSHAKGDHPGYQFQSRGANVHHEVVFYSDDEALETGFGQAAKSALSAGHTAIVFATEAHQRRIRQKLQTAGVEVEDEIKPGRCIQMDAEQVLRNIMANDLPDPAACRKLLQDILRSADESSAGQSKRIALVAECAPTLLRQGNVSGAIQLEHIWDEITGAHPVDTLCGYVWDAFPRKGMGPVLQQICAEHAAIRLGGLNF